MNFFSTKNNHNVVMIDDEDDDDDDIIPIHCVPFCWSILQSVSGGAFFFHFNFGYFILYFCCFADSFGIWMFALNRCISLSR